MKSILQQLLSSQVISIDEDENHQKLIKASKDLIKLLEKDKQKFQKVVLSAFDPEITVEDPNVVETKNLIIKYWGTFINKCQNMPLTYVRAVMLEALLNLSEKPSYAAIIWLSVSEVSVFYKSEFREKPILLEFLAKCEDQYEAVGIQEWSMDQSFTDLDIQIDIQEESKKVLGIKADYLPEKLTASVNNGNNVSNNPSYGANSVQQPWATEFGKQSGEAINSAINLIIKQTNEVLATKANISNYGDFIASFNKQASSIINDLVNKGRAAELRGELLWFKEALYSNSQNSSFRKLPVALRSIAMAHDYSNIVPVYYPKSVEYFLGETLLATNVEAEEVITFDTILDSMNLYRDQVKPYLIVHNLDKPGRLSLINYIANFLNEKVDKSELKNYTGISLEDSISWIKLTNWLYREFQAAKLIIKK